MYVTQAVDQINQNFIITNLVLSMKGSFTCEDAAKEISKCSLNVNMKTVERTLKRLRDNDYIVLKVPFQGRYLQQNYQVG